MAFNVPNDHKKALEELFRRKAVDKDADVVISFNCKREKMSWLLYKFV